jgi:hypothetical protein
LNAKLGEVEPWPPNSARIASKPIPAATGDYDEKGDCAETVNADEVADASSTESKDKKDAG